jgi:hypothetical protein
VVCIGAIKAHHSTAHQHTHTNKKTTTTTTPPSFRNHIPLAYKNNNE